MQASNDGAVQIAPGKKFGHGKKFAFSPQFSGNWNWAPYGGICILLTHLFSCFSFS